MSQEMQGTPQGVPDSAQPDVTVNTAVAPTDQTNQSLDPGFAQAPESTEGDQVAQGAPEQTEEPQTPQVSFEEYQQAQQQLEEKNQLLAQLQQIANEQKQREEEQKFRDGLQGRIRDDVAKRIADANSDDEVVSIVYGLVDNVLSDTKQQYESQVSEYHKSVEQALWTATRDGYADHLIQQNNLPASVKVSLLSSPNSDHMQLVAQQMSTALSTVQTQYQQQAVQQQTEQRKDSGVYANGGMNTGPTPQPEIKAGSARELAPALRNILGL